MRPLRVTFVLPLAISLLAMATPANAAFSDVSSGYWARSEIKYVAETQNWMRDYGSSTFKPESLLQRRHLARALVRAFAPNATPGPTFTDLPESDPFFPYASAAVKKGWMGAADGAFNPTGGVSKLALDRALVDVLGLQAEVAGLSAIRTADGTGFTLRSGFAVLVLAHQLRLHYNHPISSERRELWPSTRVRRADAAYALQRAATTPSWRISSLARYRSMVLPNVGATKRKAITFALKYAGSPYVYAGEWHRKTPSDYCCGTQVQGGFDCSGYAWWVLRKADSTWSNRAYRPYSGWILKERASRDMARAAPVRLKYSETRPGDLMFFDGDSSHTGWRGVDHAGIALGNGWMIHSASGIDGVSIDWVKEGWYRDHFKWSRRLRS